MKIYRSTSEYTNDDIINIGTYPITKMPKLKNILNSSQINGNYLKVDTGSVYLENAENADNPEWYKISPYEIDNSIYDETEIDLSTSFSDNFYNSSDDFHNSEMKLLTKNNNFLIQYVTNTIDTISISNDNKILINNKINFNDSKTYLFHPEINGGEYIPASNEDVYRNSGGAYTLLSGNVKDSKMCRISGSIEYGTSPYAGQRIVLKNIALNSAVSYTSNDELIDTSTNNWISADDYDYGKNFI